MISSDNQLDFEQARGIDFEQAIPFLGIELEKTNPFPRLLFNRKYVKFFVNSVILLLIGLRFAISNGKPQVYTKSVSILLFGDSLTHRTCDRFNLHTHIQELAHAQHPEYNIDVFHSGYNDHKIKDLKDRMERDVFLREGRGPPTVHKS